MMSNMKGVALMACLAILGGEAVCGAVNVGSDSDKSPKTTRDVISSSNRFRSMGIRAKDDSVAKVRELSGDPEAVQASQVANPESSSMIPRNNGGSATVPTPNGRAESIDSVNKKTQHGARDFHMDEDLVRLGHWRTWITILSVFLGGVLASAAGIGGGGVFVAILVLVGQFDAWDAVPLSKAMIFCGALSSTYYNVHKRHPVHGGSLVSVEAFRLIVPAALMGTFVGVFLNAAVSNGVILGLLAFVLALVTFQTYRQAIQTYFLETAASRSPAFVEIPASHVSLRPGREAQTLNLSRYMIPPIRSPRNVTPGSSVSEHTSEYPDFAPSSHTGTFVQQCWKSPRLLASLGLLFSLLFLTISCSHLFHGTLGSSAHNVLSIKWTRTRITICLVQVVAWLSVQTLMIFEVCRSSRRPTEVGNSGASEEFTRSPQKLGGETELQNRETLKDQFNTLCAAHEAVPPFRDSMPSENYIVPHGDADPSRTDDSWDSFGTCFSYSMVALMTGIFSGLLGIGGGLIFCPFMLYRKFDPLVVVATSAICVFSTSSSTTLQYLCIGRIYLPIAVMLGFITTAASFVGVRVVSYVSTRYGRKSYIMFIVAAAVAASAIACLIKIEFVPPFYRISGGSPTGQHEA